jgi:hypothetical protein
MTPHERKMLIDDMAAFLASCDRKEWSNLPGSAFWPWSPSRNKYRELAESVYAKRPMLLISDLEEMRKKGTHWP